MKSAKFDGLEAKLQTVLEGVQVIKNQPAAAKASIRAVPRENDGGGAGGQSDVVVAFQKRLAAMTPEERTIELTKLALANGTHIAR